MESDNGAPPPPPGFVLEGSQPKAPQGNAITNFVPSGLNYLGNMATGIKDAVLHPIDTVGGAVNGVVDTVYGGAFRGMDKLGLPIQPDAEEKRQMGVFDSVVGHYKDRYGSPGKAWDTFNQDPVGTLADASMVAGGAGAALKAGGFGKAASVANAVSQAADPLVGLPRAAAKLVPAELKARAAAGMSEKASKMYQSSLKPPPGSYKASEVEAMVNSGLDNRIPVSRKGLGIARDKIDAMNKTVADKIATGAAEGKTVDPDRVAKYTDRSMEAFKTVDPADQSPIAGVRDRFIAEHSDTVPYTKIAPATEGVSDTTGYVPVGMGETRIPKPIPIDEAQKLKSNTYRDIRDSYGEQASAVRETKKDLARGLKDGILDHFPELRELGQNEKVMIDLENTLERFANRQGNRDMVGLGGPAKILTGATMGGAGEVAGMLAAVMEKPEVKSRIAIALRSASRKIGKASARQPARIRQGLNAATQINQALPSEDQPDEQ